MYIYIYVIMVLISGNFQTLPQILDPATVSSGGPGGDEPMVISATDA